MSDRELLATHDRGDEASADAGVVGNSVCHYVVSFVTLPQDVVLVATWDNFAIQGPPFDGNLVVFDGYLDGVWVSWEGEGGRRGGDREDLCPARNGQEDRVDWNWLVNSGRFHRIDTRPRVILEDDRHVGELPLADEPSRFIVVVGLDEPGVWPKGLEGDGVVSAHSHEGVTHPVENRVQSLGLVLALVHFHPYVPATDTGFVWFVEVLLFAIVDCEAVVGDPHEGEHTETVQGSGGDF